MRFPPLITRLCQPAERLDAAILIFKCKNDINCILMTCLVILSAYALSQGYLEVALVGFFCLALIIRKRETIATNYTSKLISLSACFRLNESQLCCQIFLIFNCKFLKNWHFLIYFNLI